MTPQTPEVPPRYRFRTRGDHYTTPTFRTPMTPRVPVQPYERYDPDHEARPLEWADLQGARPWLGGLLMFIVIAAFCVVAGIVGVQPDVPR